MKKQTTFAQQQQLKCLLRSLNPQQLKGALYKLRNIVGSQLEASSKMISYKCYEFSIGYKAHRTFGYGRNETEAHINCIQNFLELLIEDENLYSLIKEILTKSVSNETCETPDRPQKHENAYRLTTEPLEETLLFDHQTARADEKEAFHMHKLDALKENAANISNISAIMFDSSFNASKLDLGELLKDLASNEKERKFNKTQKKSATMQMQKSNNENEKLTSRASLKMTKEEFNSKSPRNAFEGLEREKHRRGSDTARYHTQKELKPYVPPNYENNYENTRKILSHREPIEYKFDTNKNFRSKERENYSSNPRDLGVDGREKFQTSLQKR